jgi:hypothetical protein
LILPVLLWFCLISFSVCRIPWRIFYSGGLVRPWFRMTELWTVQLSCPQENQEGPRDLKGVELM